MTVKELKQILEKLSEADDNMEVAVLSNGEYDVVNVEVVVESVKKVLYIEKAKWSKSW